MKRSDGEKLKEKSAAYFDRIAADNEVIPEPARCYGILLDRLSPEPAGSLADIGCGTGVMLGRIREEYGDRFRLYGLDLSKESLRQAEQNCGGDVVLSQGDVDAMPYEDGMFDLILCMHSFHHYPHPVRALSEVRRVLKPDGLFLLVENDYPTRQRIHLNYRLWRQGYPAGDIRMYSRGTLKLLAALAGFRVEKASRIADHSQLLECRKRRRR